MHGDHFDPLVQQKLDRHIPITTTEESAEILGKMGFNKRYALKTRDSLNLKKAARRYNSPRCRGVTAPAVAAKLLPDVMGSILDFTAQGQNFSYSTYISGDTMVYGEIREIPGATLTWILRYCTGAEQRYSALSR
jgi:hypothetical protein